MSVVSSAIVHDASYDLVDNHGVDMVITLDAEVRLYKGGNKCNHRCSYG